VSIQYQRTEFIGHGDKALSRHSTKEADKRFWNFADLEKKISFLPLHLSINTLYRSIAFLPIYGKRLKTVS
jgi:hypothetical protein